MRGEWEISFWVIILSQKRGGFSFDSHGDSWGLSDVEALPEKGLRAGRRSERAGTVILILRFFFGENVEEIWRDLLSKVDIGAERTGR